MNLKKLFTKHPNCIGETYWQHNRCAIKYSLMFFLAGVVCMIHAWFPFLFEKTASSIARNIIKCREDREE